VPTVMIPRPGVTVAEVAAVLRARLGSRYRITPSMTSKGFVKEVPDAANTMLVRGRRLERANVRIVSAAGGTEVHVSPGATYPGLIRLIDRISVVRAVRRAIEQSPELASGRQVGDG
jgi:hypothetical protein